MSMGAAQTVATKPDFSEEPMRLPNPMPDEVPNVIMTGSGEKLSEVKERLERSNIRVDYFENSNDMIYTASPSTVAAIFVQPVMGESVGQDINRFKSKGAFRTLPVFAVLPDTASNDQVRSLFKAGANDVFQWLTDSSKLPALILEHMKRGKRGRGLTKQDRRLSKAISARLRVFARCGRQVKISVRNGKAFVMGRIESFKKKRKIEDIVSATPGVNRVVSKSVFIPMGEEYDNEIVTSIHERLSGVTFIRERAISVSANQGMLTVAGSVGTKDEMNHVLKLCGSVDGVKSINNLLAISKDQTVEDSSLARKVQSFISGFFIQSKIRISVIKDTAFLTGNVDMRGKKKLVEDVVLRQFSPISKVINNIQTG